MRGYSKTSFGDVLSRFIALENCICNEALVYFFARNKNV